MPNVNEDLISIVLRAFAYLQKSGFIIMRYDKSLKDEKTQFYCSI